MTAVVPQLNKGSIVDHFRPIWAGYYSAIEKIIGDGGIIIPLLDPDHSPSATTLTTRTHHTDGPSAEITGTWSEAPTAFDTPADLSDLDKYQGCIPFVQLNGSDEYLSLVDDAFWSQDDNAGANGFSMGVWVNLDDLDGTASILTKYDETTAAQAREWYFRFSTGKVQIRLYDESANAHETEIADAAVTAGQWVFVSFVYDGAGGVSANGGIDIYINGALVASTGSDSGTYVGMEDLAGLVYLGAQEGTGGTAIGFLDGKIAGGPFSPFFTTKELSAVEIQRLYTLGKKALGLN